MRVLPDSGPVADAVTAAERAERVAGAVYERGTILMRWTTRAGSLAIGVVLGAAAVAVPLLLGWDLHLPLWPAAVVMAASVVLNCVAGVVLAGRAANATWVQGELDQATNALVRIAQRAAQDRIDLAVTDRDERRDH